MILGGYEIREDQGATGRLFGKDDGLDLLEFCVRHALQHSETLGTNRLFFVSGFRLHLRDASFAMALRRVTAYETY
jgi:hypothetical protein